MKRIAVVLALILAGALFPAGPAAAAADPTCTVTASGNTLTGSCSMGTQGTSFRIVLYCRNAPAIGDYYATSAWTPTTQTITMSAFCPYGGDAWNYYTELAGSATPPPSESPVYHRYGSYGHGEQCNEIGAAGLAAHTWSSYFCQVVSPATWSAPGLYFLWVTGPA